MTYQHTQFGAVILAVCMAIGAVTAAVAWRAGSMPLIVMLIVLVAVAVIFNSLTIELEGRELRWYFGPGWWTYRLTLDEIRSVSVVRNRWWNGFGIRKAPGFSLYNVSGLDAVELKLTSGDICRIGTDDPQGLAAAIGPSLRAPAA